MRHQTKQPLRLRIEDWNADGRHVVLTVQAYDVKPGRSDIAVGPPTFVAIPDELWLDEKVCDLANERHLEMLKRMRERERQAWIEGQPALFEKPGPGDLS